LGREAGSFTEEIESPIQGTAKDGPEEIDDSFAVRGVEIFVDLSPKIEYRYKNNGAGYKGNDGGMEDSCGERVAQKEVKSGTHSRSDIPGKTYIAKENDPFANVRSAPY